MSRQHFSANDECDYVSMTELNEQPEMEDVYEGSESSRSSNYDYYTGWQEAHAWGTQLEAELAEIRSSKERLEYDNSTLHETLEKVKHELEVEKRLSKQQASATGTALTTSQLQDNLSQVEQELADVRIYVARLESESANLRKKLTVSEEELRREHDARMMAEKNLKALETITMKIKDVSLVAVELQEKAEADLREKEVHHKNIRKTHLREIDKLKSENMAMQRQSSILLSNVVGSGNMQMLNTLAELENVQQELIKQKMEFNTQKDALENTVEELNGTIQQMQLKINASQDEITHHKKVEQDLKRKLKHLQRDSDAHKLREVPPTPPAPAAVDEGLYEPVQVVPQLPPGPPPPPPPPPRLQMDDNPVGTLSRRVKDNQSARAALPAVPGKPDPRQDLQGLLSELGKVVKKHGEGLRGTLKHTIPKPPSQPPRVVDEREPVDPTPHFKLPTHSPKVIPPAKSRTASESSPKESPGDSVPDFMKEFQKRNLARKASAPSQ